jgi:hypothetical protein
MNIDMSRRAALRPERLRSRHDFCALLDSQMRAAVASTCMGEAGVAEADLHYQLATYFLEVYGPEMPRYVDLAWHLRQAQDQATLWNVITQPRALRHFLGEEGVGGTDWCVGLLSQFGRCGWNCPAQYLLSLSLSVCVCLSVRLSVCLSRN